MDTYPENRDYTDEPDARFPVGEPDTYYIGKAVAYVDNLQKLIDGYDVSNDASHPLETMMPRAQGEADRQKPGHRKTFAALRTLAGRWDGSDDGSCYFDATSEGLALALVFVRESHLLPSQYGDFSEELTHMQGYAKPDASFTVADYARNVWDGMQRSQPIVHGLFTEMKQKLLDFHHVETDSEQAVRVEAGMALVYAVSLASQLENERLNSVDDYFAPTYVAAEPGKTRQEIVDEWVVAEPTHVPNIQAVLGSELGCVKDADRRPPLPASIVAERALLAELDHQAVIARRKKDYEDSIGRTTAILGGFLHGGAASTKSKNTPNDSEETM